MESVSRGGLYGRMIFLGLLALCSIYLVFTPAHSGAVPFMKLLNFPFDFSGRMLGGMFGGRKVAAMGGFIMMWAATLAGVLSFLLQKEEPFGASVFLWWHGQVIYLLGAAVAGTYNIASTRRSVPAIVERELGYTIKYMVNSIQMRMYERETVWIVHFIASSVIILSLIWATVIVVKQYLHIRESY